MKQEDIERKCIATGRVLPKKQLLRFTVSPDNQIIPDFKKKLPGKGIYVTNSFKVLQSTVEKNLFAKVLKRKIRVEASLTVLVEQLLKKKALDAVSLARKAGVLVTGLDKVLDSLKKGKVAFVLEAQDAGDDGHQRILLQAKDVNVYRLFGTEELDTALNKVNTVHAAFVKSEMAKMVQNEFNKLADFLNSEEVEK